MLKSIASGIVLAALVTPALADEYWVVYDPSTKQCSVAEKKSDEAATRTTTDTPIDTTADTTKDKETTKDTDTTKGKNKTKDTDTRGGSDVKLLLDAIAANAADTKKTFIGSKQKTRADAEYEMTIMRKCGIAN